MESHLDRVHLRLRFIDAWLDRAIQRESSGEFEFSLQYHWQADYLGSGDILRGIDIA